MAKKMTRVPKHVPSTDARTPNAATRQALQDAEQVKDLIRYASFTDFARAMTGK